MEISLKQSLQERAKSSAGDNRATKSLRNAITKKWIIYIKEVEQHHLGLFVNGINSAADAGNFTYSYSLPVRYLYNENARHVSSKTVNPLYDVLSNFCQHHGIVVTSTYAQANFRVSWALGAVAASDNKPISLSFSAKVGE